MTWRSISIGIRWTWGQKMKNSVFLIWCACQINHNYHKYQTGLRFCSQLQQGVEYKGRGPTAIDLHVIVMLNSMDCLVNMNLLWSIWEESFISIHWYIVLFHINRALTMAYNHDGWVRVREHLSLGYCMSCVVHGILKPLSVRKWIILWYPAHHTMHIFTLH